MIKDKQGLVYNKTLKYILYGLTIIAVMTFLFTPMTGDLKVFFGGARQAEYISDNLIVGSYKQWELKSVFSRLLIYILYKIVTLFVPFVSYGMEIGVNLLYIVFVSICIWCSVKTFVKKTNKNKSIMITCGIVLGILTTHAGCHIQVEMTCTVLILLAFSLYVNAIRTKQHELIKLILAGLLIGATFYFKSVLILLSVSVVAAVGIWEVYTEQKASFIRLIIVASSSVVMLILNGILIWMINPMEFQSILDASAFQETLFSAKLSLGTIIYLFITNFIEKIFMIPILIPGIVALMCNVIYGIRKRQWKLLFFHIVLWFMPFLIVILSNRYFLYHFVVFIFASAIEIGEVWYRREKIEKNLLGVVALPVSVVYLLFISVFSKNFYDYASHNYEVYRRNEVILDKIEFDNKADMLYLDDGVGAYLLGSESYLEYYYPLPLQRLDASTELDCYHKSYKKTMEYEGKYISVLEGWFFNEKNTEIRDKVMEEYEKLTSYIEFSVPHSLTESAAFREFDLYVRKSVEN